jgi:hypothetical protein
MKGEKVDMNSIKNSVMEEMKGVQQRATKFGAEAKAIATEKGKAFASEIGSAGKRSGNIFGRIISMFVKIIVYFVLGCVGFALIAALFSLAFVSIGVFPLKDFLLTSGWQNAFAWGTLIFFIAVPIIGIIVWLIRKITKTKTGGVMMRSTFTGLWVLGWVRQNIFRFKPFNWIDEDTVLIPNMTINIFKSTNDSFKVTMLKIANGQTLDLAKLNASKIRFNVAQQDTVLMIDKGIQINKDDKFRNQQIVLNIYVPVGKQIRIDNSVSRWGGLHFDGISINDGNWEFESEDGMRGWNTGVDYIMKADGLYNLFGERADNRDDNNNNNRGRKRTRVVKDGVVIQDSYEDEDGNNVDYRYDNKPGAKTAIDSLKEKQQLEIKHKADSIKESIERSKKELEKIDKKADAPTAMNTTILQGYNPMLLLN